MIVVTGAGGSIGRALLEPLSYSGIGVGIDIEDWDITRPYAVDAASARYEPDPYVVFHLAASKDAPEGEKDPAHVAAVNIRGTQNVLARWPNSRIILASTCKACDPETAYGASKLIAERLVLNAGGSVARFHNVRETSGNVFRTWERYTNGPIPVTNCARYFIGIDQAVHLLLKVMALPAGRYMTYPGPRRQMSDVANDLYPGRGVTYIPRRRGDRAIEPLVASHETVHPTRFAGILEVRSPHD